LSVRVGVDVGGTFTDVVVFDESSGRLSLLKAPSTPAQPGQAVVDGTRRILNERGLPAEAVRFFLHGTTVATNALIQKKGVRVVLVVTKGFRDVLHIMRQDRPRLYDYFVHRPAPLVPRNLRLEVPERILYTGAVRTPLSDEAVSELVEKVRRSEVMDVAVCLLHSYANPAHEEKIRSALEAGIPGVRTSLSSEILPEFREFERMSTTAVNAYVLPKVASYFHDLEQGLTELGIPSRLHIMQSNGGLAPSETARRHPVQTILSGPAAGALSGLRLGQQAGYQNVISIDVGGTSADVSLAHNGRLRFAEESEIAQQVIKIPMIEIETVGAGGGSLAWIDRGGGLQVGPQSAGADPGPACYGRGGRQPTVTDANVALRRINPDYFLGGEMKIDASLASRAIQENIAEPLDLGLEEAAEGILRVINAVMSKAIRRLSVERGYDPRDFTLVSFGGGGPLHAVDLALDLQVPRVVVPPTPGVSSALGLLTADFRHDYVQTLLWKTPERKVGELLVQLEALKSRALDQMTSEGIPPEMIEYLPAADMRYQGQSFTLEVNFHLAEAVAWESHAELENRFHERHHVSFGYREDSEPTEIVNVRLVSVGRMPRPALERLPSSGSDPSAARKGRRQVYLRGEWRDTAVYERSLLQHGNRIDGPALVEQVDSTTLFYPAQSATVDEFGNLIIQVA
jgi:N-methylhydantoinase A